VPASSTLSDEAVKGNRGEWIDALRAVVDAASEETTQLNRPMRSVI
jgi:hypothetical protein